MQEVEGKEDREDQVVVERERRLKEVRSWMTTSSNVQECALCASSAYHVHHASVCVNVVIGVLVVLCELHVVVRVHVILVDDAVSHLVSSFML